MRTHQVTHQVAHLLDVLKQGPLTRASLMKHLGLEDPVSFRLTCLEPALSTELVEMTQPDSPRSPTQKYRLTAKGIEALNTVPVSPIFEPNSENT
jgi:ATP-dependent DNA helicase RecG